VNGRETYHLMICTNHTDTALNEAFFASMPKPVRELLHRRMADVAFSTSLGKSACVALCLLYRARMLEDGAPEARQRLISQSNRYFQQAVFHLQSGEVPLEAQLLAVFDMQAYQVLHCRTFGWS
jgi:hypothetical protein